MKVYPWEPKGQNCLLGSKQVVVKYSRPRVYGTRKAVRFPPAAPAHLHARAPPPRAPGRRPVMREIWWTRVPRLVSESRKKIKVALEREERASREPGERRSRGRENSILEDSSISIEQDDVNTAWWTSHKSRLLLYNLGGDSWYSISPRAKGWSQVG